MEWEKCVTLHSFMRIEELQFGAMMTTALLTLTLASQIPQRVSRTVNRARWLMVAAMVLLFVQFFVQYRFGFRAMGEQRGGCAVLRLL